MCDGMLPSFDDIGPSHSASSVYGQFAVRQWDSVHILYSKHDMYTNGNYYYYSYIKQIPRIRVYMFVLPKLPQPLPQLTLGVQ
jgi:hypothetical protein